MMPSVVITALILAWFAHYTRAATLFNRLCKTKSIEESHSHVASPAIEEAYKGSSFPMPKLHLNINSQEKSEESSYFTLSEEVQLSIVSDVDGQPVSKLLTAAIDRWCERRALFPPSPQNSAKHHAESIKTIVLSIAPSIPTIDAASCATHVPSSSARLCQDSGNHTTDKEAYRIEMKTGADTITVHIAGIHGGINALSALSQLLFVPLKASDTVSIMDWPTKRWRGLMLDMSRHFIPPKLIYKTIDAMELSRLNILHLHLTDSQSFPIELEDVVLANGSTLVLSSLAKQGAFSHDKVYRLQDLRDIVAYATVRGIEVIPEIDMPAHALSWGKAFTDVIVPCHVLANSQQTPHNIYPLDPSNPTTFLLVEEILKQIVGIFPSRFLHIGGDEVNEQCWRESVALQEWAKRTNVNAHQLTKYFETEVFRIVLHKLKKIPIVWQGILDAGNVPEESVFTGEGTQSTTTAVRSRGRRLTSVASAMTTEEPLLLFPSGSSSSSSEDTAKVIIEPWKCWGGLAVRAAAEAIGRRQYPVWMAACHYLDYNSDWTTFLMTDQLGKVDPAFLPKPYSSSSSSGSSAASAATTSSASKPNDRRQHSDYFLGGEGAMWTECVDHTNFECRVWPRAGAIAQSLWGFHPVVDSPTTTTSTAYSSSPSDSAALTLPFTQYLYASYVHFRYFLSHVLHVAAAPLIFHYPERSGNHGASSTSALSLSLSQDALASSASSISSAATLSSGPQNLVPIYPKNMSRALQLIDALEAGITITSSGPKVIASLPRGAIHKAGHQMWISSQCLGIPESIQRPLTTSSISVAQLNIADGSLGLRRDQMLAWLQSKAQAGVMVVGFCELVGWNTLHSKTELVKNLPWLALRAAHAGFVHSYVSKPFATNAYPVGLVSIYPLEVLHEWHAPHLQRGAVHVYIAALQLHVVVVHLHAHDATLRAQEAAWLMHMLQPILTRGERLVLMGDLNTLSPYDRQHHEAQGLLRLLERSDHPVFPRLRKKFTTPDGQHMDYRAMQHFLNAGLRDSCVEMCCQAAHTRAANTRGAARGRTRRTSTATASKSAYETCRVPLNWPLTALHGGSGTGSGTGGGGGLRKEEAAAHESTRFDAAALRAAYDAAGMPSWSLATAASPEANGTTTTAAAPDTAFVTCMRQYCARSEPTQFNPEWPAHVGVEHPQIRLDYILMNDAALGIIKREDGGDVVGGHMVTAGIEATNVTTILSDHFPAYASWKDPRQFPNGVDLFV